MRLVETKKAPARLSRTEVAGDAPEWPMAVADFLAGDYLDRADVMLARRHGSLYSWLIRFATKSHFSHAGLVFLVPSREAEFDNTFVIEAGTKGVVLSNLADYFSDRTSVVAIKRFRSIPPVRRPNGAPVPIWFTEAIQKRVRGRLLNKIKSQYNYRTVLNIAWDIIDQMLFSVSERTRGRKVTLERRRKRGHTPPNAFICSGLVQLGFLDTVGELVRAGKLPPHALKEVVFDKEIAGLLPNDWSAFTPAEVVDIVDLFLDGWSSELEAVKPVDLARSLQLEWRHVVIDGWVHRVKSYEETYELLKWSPDSERASVTG